MWWNWEAMRAPPVAEEASRARGSGRQMPRRKAAEGRCRAPQQEDSLDLGAVTSVKVFPSLCHCEPDRLSGVAIRSLKAGLPVFISRGSGERPHLGYLSE